MNTEDIAKQVKSTNKALLILIILVLLVIIIAVLTALVLVSPIALIGYIYHLFFNLINDLHRRKKNYQFDKLKHANVTFKK